MVSTDPTDPHFGLETDPSSPNFGSPGVPEAPLYPEGSPEFQDIGRAKLRSPFLIPGLLAHPEPDFLEQLRQMAEQPETPLAPPDEPPPELPSTLSERTREGGVLGAVEPYAEGIGQTIEGMIPTSREQVEEFTRPPMGGIDLQTENQLGAAWRGEYGPKAQAAAISGTVFQALPLLHLPFAKTPFPPSARDLALVKRIRDAQQAQVPPPIPPEYAQRQFTAPGLESGWQMGSWGEHIPVGQPEAPPQTAPVPPLFETMKAIPPTPDVRAVPQSTALGPAQPGFVMHPETPDLAPAPSLEETLQKAQPPPVDPNLATHERTRAILDNRQRILNEMERIRPLVENARKLIPGGERALEAEWADLNAQLNNKETNPVVHAPPPRTGVPSETARLPGAGVPVGPPMGEPPVPSSEVRTNIPSETARLPEDKRFPRGGPASEPGARPERPEEPRGVKTAEPSEEAAKYGGPAAAREALREQLKRDQAARIKARIQKEGGFISKVTMEDIRNLGKDVYEWGMDFHQWAAEMLNRLGKAVAGHLQDIWASIQATAPYRAWEEITGGRLRSVTKAQSESYDAFDRRLREAAAFSPLDLSKPENFELVDQVVPLDVIRPAERGSVGGTGGPKPLVWKDVSERGIRKLETPDGKYQIRMEFVGNWRGHTGKYKEMGWAISKRNSRGELEDTGGAYTSLADAKRYAAERTKEYGYDHIGYTVEERNAQSAAERLRPTERGSVGRTGLSGKQKFVSVDSNGDRHTGEWDPDLSAVPKLLATAPKEEANLYRTKNILGTKSDPKTVKGEKYGVSTYISYLAAEKGSKVVNMCVFATEKCTEGCLGKGGNARYDTVVQGRINKTKYFAYDPVTYFRQLDGEILKAKARAIKDGNVLAIRLNGTSDVLWEKSGIIQRHPDVQFYDYTKYPQPLRQNLPPNYHLTYSYTGTSASDTFSRRWYEHGVNTAVVFRDGMPAEFLGRPVIDGDVSDLRFLDPDGVIVGLHAKGKLLLKDADGKYIETNEFVYDTPPDQVAIPYFDPRQKEAILKGEFLGEEALGAMKDLAPKAGDLKYIRGNPDLGFNQPGATPQLTPIQAFRERLQARRAAIRGEGRQLGALGFDPEDTALQAAIGGTYIAEGVTDFAKWSAAMVKEFGPDIEPHLTNLWKTANIAHQTFQQTGRYTTEKQTAPARDAPIGVRNETLRAREDAGVSTAPPPGIGVSWKDSVDRGNKALDDPVNPADPYKIISDFNKDSLIGHPRLDPVRAWLERLQKANNEAHGALEQDPGNADLAREAVRTQTAEDEFTAAYQPMKTEWSRSGTGMQEERGITDADLLSQKSAEQTMRDHMDRELNDSDKARAADAVKRTREANATSEEGFSRALEHAEKAAKAPPMTPEQMKEHFAKRIKELTPC